MFGLTNTFRAFAIAGIVVLVILVLAQYTASLLEKRGREEQGYEFLSDRNESKSDEPKEFLNEPSNEEQDAESKSKEEDD